MIITDILPIDKKRSKVYIDEEYAFPLYLGEIRRYKIKVGEEITEEVYDEILNKVIDKRCKLRAMNILKKVDKTEKQLRDKLKQGFYPEDTIDNTIEYLKSYRYIDDSRYADSYVEYRMKNKSKKQVVNELLQKGIDKEQALESIPDDYDELEAIRNLIAKKKYNDETADINERRKMYQYLLRKGFNYNDISHIIHDSDYREIDIYFCAI